MGFLNLLCLKFCKGLLIAWYEDTLLYLVLPLEAVVLVDGLYR